MSRHIALITKFVLATALTATGWAQIAPPPSEQPDPEDRNHGVARVSLLNGDVSVRRGDSGDFIAGALNAPLLVQDSLHTGPASRAEVQFDSANRLRIGENAEVRMAELVANKYQVQLARGTTTLNVQRDSASQIEIDTPSVAIRPSRAGAYRVAVLEDGTTQITVRAGEARVDSARGEERLAAGQTMLARGSADNPEFQVVAAIGRDDWDVFNERRDRDLDHSESARYVSRDIAGAEDLDAYGQWETDPTYGQVWAPRVAADWAPYRSGRWVWEDYYGWTWVSYDPWGWAPYHYGNWFIGARGWRWFPGSRFGHYGYRPALVGFFGFGAGVGVGFGFGNIGWVPLAPFETFHPWYGRGFGAGYRGFGAGVNVAGAYRNARFANGVTAMNAQDFASGRFGRFSSVGANELRQASLVHGALPVTPTNGSLRFNDRQTGVTGRNTFGQTRFASHNQPTQTVRTPFQQQQQSFGRQFSSQGGVMSNAGVGARQGGSAQNGGASGWQRFGAPNQSSPGVSPRTDNSFGRPAGAQASPQGQSGSTWQRFGAPNPGTASRPQSNFGQSRPAYPANPAPAPRSFSQPSMQSRQDGGSRSVQVAPPMVRERAAPSYSRPSQPSYHSAPAASQRSAPAPAAHSSNGGGASHGSESHHGR